MKVWKFIPLLLVVFAVSSCSSASSDDSAKSANSSATAPANAPASSPAVSAPKNDKPLAPVEKVVESVTLPAGTEIDVTLSNSLNSGKNKSGDDFEGALALPLNVDGKTIFDKGTKVMGKVVDAQESGRVKGRASMRLALTGIMHHGKTVEITTNPFISEAESTKGRDAAVVGGGAGLGAVIGAIAGGKKGAVTGGVIGGAAGGGTVLATRGKEVDFPAESKITFTLSDSLTVRR